LRSTGPAPRPLRAFRVSISPAKNRPRRRAFRHRSEALFFVATRRFTSRFACRFARRSPCVSHRARIPAPRRFALPSTCLRTACRPHVRRTPPALRRLRVRVPSAAQVLRELDASSGCARPGSAMYRCMRGAVVRELGLGLARSRRRAAGKREAGPLAGKQLY
jgi:hypothetical protein